MDSCITLNKGGFQTFKYQKFFDVILGWNDDSKGYSDDIDMCLFYKTKNNTIGGVFNSSYVGSYNQKIKSEGSLSDFPFVLLMDEERIKPKYDWEEIIRIAQLSEFEKVYIVAIDYTATINNEDVGFTSLITLETVKTTPTITLTSQRNLCEKGTICLLTTLQQNDDESIVMNHESKYISLSEAYEQIPGFSTICSIN